MLSAIVRVSLRHCGVIIALAAIALAYGIYAVVTAKYDVFPEFATPQIASRSPCPTTSVKSEPVWAPSAMRMPISCVRCVTE